MVYGNSRQRGNRSTIILGHHQTYEAQLPHPIAAANLHRSGFLTDHSSSRSSSSKAGSLGLHKSHSGEGTGGRRILVVAAHVTGGIKDVAQNLAKET